MMDLTFLRQLVETESPSDDPRACEGLAAIIAARLTAAGGRVTRHPAASRGSHVEAAFGDGGGRPVLIVGHYDTVWPVGTLARMPFRVDGGKAYGPGIFDMKTSIAMVDAIVRAQAPRRPLVILFTSDEEVGSQTSRALIEARAREAAHVLVLEPPIGPGVLKLRRKGIGRFLIEVTGRAAHAGLEPEKGVSAIVELAHQMLRVDALNDPAQGSTVTVGTVHGGTRANVVPAAATAELDVRMWTTAEAQRLAAAIHGLTPVLPGAFVRGSGRLNRPPMELSPAQLELFERARALASGLGIELTHGAVGGGSDGNFTATLAPTLDGLGCPGAGAHAEHEHILLDHLDRQVALLASLLTHL